MGLLPEVRREPLYQLELVVAIEVPERVGDHAKQGVLVAELVTAETQLHHIVLDDLTDPAVQALLDLHRLALQY